MISFNSSSTAETLNFAADFAKKLIGGVIITLKGDLGAGKTHFVKGLAKGLLIDDLIVSPTFTIMNEYHGRLELFHFDCYRLACGDEARESGICEFIGRKDAVTVIEWAENIKDILLNFDIIEIELIYKSENERQIIINEK